MSLTEVPLTPTEVPLTPKRAQPLDQINLDGMSLDELWELREQLRAALSNKMLAEKRRIDQLLVRLNDDVDEVRPAPRRYPPVPQRYGNPEDPSQTWSGRGKMPKWVEEQLRCGKTLRDLQLQTEHTAPPPEVSTQ